MTGADTIFAARGLSRDFVVSAPLFGPPTLIRAVNGVDLDVMAGETLAIVGESGCGKSTLARLLVRLIEPTAGEVLYEGRDIAHISAREMRALRKDLQFIFQDPFSSLNPTMTVGALIAEPLHVHRIGSAAEQRDRVDELLRRVGLTPGHRDRYPHEFSGGQRQRIGIARALATGPKVIIGDEPVSALDVSIQAQVVNILEGLREEFGLTLIVIAHDLAVIRHMATRVAVMYMGEIVEIAETQEIFLRPKHPYTEALLSAIPIASVDARPARPTVEGDPPNPVAPPPGCRFHPRCAYATEVCRTERPPRHSFGDHTVACHHAAELALAGLEGAEATRSEGAAQRFALYKAARGSVPTTGGGAKTSER